MSLAAPLLTSVSVGAVAQMMTARRVLNNEVLRKRAVVDGRMRVRVRGRRRE